MAGKSFKNKIIWPVVTVLVALTVTLTVYISVKFMSYSHDLIDEKVNANINSLKLYIDESRSFASAAAVSMARDPEAIRAIKNRDREEIIRVFTPTYSLYNVNYYTVTDEKGDVLARTHEPETYGDNVIKQKNVENALKGVVSNHFEAGTVVKVSTRTGAPVYDTDSTLIGVVSAGVRFDLEEVVDNLKRIFRSDVTIFFGDTRVSTTIMRDGQRIVGTKMDPAIAKTVLEDKREISRDTEIFGVSYKTVYIPLLNAKGEAFATIFAGTPTSELRKEANALIRNIIIISLLGLIVSILILYKVVSSVSRPLIELSKDMDQIGNGNFNVKINTDSQDEVGHVGRSLQKLANVVHELIDGINLTISESRKGNTYRIDTGVFSGDYRLLAERIVELSEISITDKLTGLPNRRIFEARIGLEWRRAARDRKPLSFLIMDIDKFKVFNDTYGHQQGDVVLQVVAKTLSQSLKRGVDFVARWGGEEFVVLLPSTDSDGAMHVAEKIRAGVASARVPSLEGGEPLKVTISIGANTQLPDPGSQTTPERAIENLISKADEALYRAKETGRNRVCRHEEEASPPPQPAQG